MKLASRNIRTLAPRLWPRISSGNQLPPASTSWQPRRESVMSAEKRQHAALRPVFSRTRTSDEAHAKKANFWIAGALPCGFSNFAGEGAYDPAGSNAPPPPFFLPPRSQLQSPAGPRIVGANPRPRERSRRLFHQDRRQGNLPAVLHYPPRAHELTIVNRKHTRSRTPAALGGQFHIPAMDLAFRDKGKPVSQIGPNEPY